MVETQLILKRPLGSLWMLFQEDDIHIRLKNLVAYCITSLCSIQVEETELTQGLLLIQGKLVPKLTLGPFLTLSTRNKIIL